MEHGDFATVTLPGGDEIAYKKLRKELISELAPNGQREADIVETIASVRVPDDHVPRASFVTSSDRTSG